MTTTWDSDPRDHGAPRRRWRAVWLGIHRWLALTVGLVFVLLGLTGSVNVFHWELEEWGLPKPQAPGHAGARPPLDAILADLKARYPERRGNWLLFLPGYERDYLWAVYPEPEETAGELFAPLRIIIDPGTAEIVAQHYWGRTLWTFIYEIHASLLTGKLGRDIGLIGFKTVSLLGLLLLISAATGLYLWWPRTGQFGKALRFKRGASSTRFHFDLHRVTGSYGSAFLVLIAFTGFSFGWKDYLKPLVARFSPVQAEHFKDPAGLKSQTISGAATLSVGQAVAIADRVFPEAELRWIATPAGPEGVYAIEKRQPGEANRRRPRSKVWIDQYSGQVLAVEDPRKFTAGETFFNLMWPLHNGEALGLPGRILWCIVGCMPLILYLTGITLWLRKRRARRLARNKAMKRTIAYRPASRARSKGVQNE